jgi:hypothetical protein
MYGIHSNPVIMTVSVSQNNSRVMDFPLDQLYEFVPAGRLIVLESASLRYARTRT